uniref:Uncharacterized protein n=1 Tax=Anser cygnoides TaxID=8845 RepID=A0A8B9EDT1_ANSCY
VSAKLLDETVGGKFPNFPVGSSCSLPRVFARWLQWGCPRCSGTSDRSCSLEFSGWLANAKSKGKPSIRRKLECNRSVNVSSSHLFRDRYVNFLSGHSRT